MLPNEILEKITHFLDLENVLSLSCCSKRMKDINKSGLMLFSLEAVIASGFLNFIPLRSVSD